MSIERNTKWIRGYWKGDSSPSGCLSGLLKPFLLGIGTFSALISLLMSIFGESDEPIQGKPQQDPDITYIPYPYDPSDPTEGGIYPNPNDPSIPIVFLPPGQGGGSIYPILPGRIIVDPIDSMRHVVSDRLNVLLEKENDSTGTAFMKEFKNLYPSQDYQFVYFDTLSYRMQMVVPPDKRNYLKNNLNKQMPTFDFILFDEEVFALSATPADPGFKDRNKSWYFDAINTYQAWDITQGDPNIIVAVVDNGFDLNHPELNGKVVKPKNMPERNAHIFPIIDAEGHDHGTHVAATAIGKANNGHGVSGIAPGCQFMPVQVATADGMMPNTMVMDGVLYAIYNGASVVNVSLGPEPPQWFCLLSPQQQQRYISNDDQRLAMVWRKIYSIADKHNCTIVVAAGNENILSGYASKARTDSVIVVSAVDQGLRKATFSNYGEYAGWNTNYSTVSAPGVDIYNAINRGQYASLQGTSMASPIVAGAVALMKSVNPNLRTMDIREILRSTGRPLFQPIGPLIQIDRALQKAQNWTPQPSTQNKNNK